jgi:hypothetical protein
MTSPRGISSPDTSITGSVNMWTLNLLAGANFFQYRQTSTAATITATNAATTPQAEVTELEVEVDPICEEKKRNGRKNHRGRRKVTMTDILDIAPAALSSPVTSSQV